MSTADPDVPHPRERHRLLGQDDAADALSRAEAQGRLHHAWLVGGPKGIGKATLAYRFARWLLAPPSERRGGEDGLEVDPEGRTARQVAARSHPNLLALELAAEADGKAAAKTIPVEAVRKVTGFFGTTSADGGRRVCIVDAVDDLTPAGANALLKTVEEPPTGGLILLVSHAPQRIIPTIRSRCRRLNLSTLSAAEIGDVVGSLGSGAPPDAALLQRAAMLADGSVARALTLLDPKRIALMDEVALLLAALPHPPQKRVLALADRLADRRADADYALALDAILRWLSDRVEADQGRGVRRLAPLAEVCERVTEAARLAETYNLDRRPLLISIFGDVAEAVRGAA